MPVRSSLVAALWSLLVGGCFVDIDYGGTSFRCEADPSSCPGSQVCFRGQCVEPDQIDAAVPDASAVCGDDRCTEDCTSCAADCGECQSGQLLHWPFDETEGAEVGDASGAGLDGLSLDATRVDSPLGGALLFDGDEDEVRLAPAPPALETATVAVAAWVKPTMGRGEVASFGDNWGLRVLEDGNARIFIHLGMSMFDGADTLTTDLLDGSWHHLVGQYDGAALEVWVDGALAGQKPVVEPIAFELGPDLVVGRHGNGITTFDYTGEMDDVRVFGRALSETEISALASFSVGASRTSAPAR